jgi:hypothetical protein
MKTIVAFSPLQEPPLEEVEDLTQALYPFIVSGWYSQSQYTLSVTDTNCAVVQQALRAIGFTHQATFDVENSSQMYDTINDLVAEWKAEE